MNFDYGGHILVYNSGLLPEEYGHLSLGIVLLCYNIRHAIENKRKVFDFLRGNEVYKYRMGAKDNPVFMLRAARLN
jgi:CelD/BcsL family acetyltransferase involved in cellulose biosynthesis